MNSNLQIDGDGIYWTVRWGEVSHTSLGGDVKHTGSATIVSVEPTLKGKVQLDDKTEFYNCARGFTAPKEDGTMAKLRRAMVGLHANAKEHIHACTRACTELHSCCTYTLMMHERRLRECSEKEGSSYTLSTKGSFVFTALCTGSRRRTPGLSVWLWLRYHSRQLAKAS